MSYKKKILLVEDDDQTRFMMAEFLEHLGANFDMAVDGQHCLDTLAERPGDYFMVLMDMHMPVLSGCTAAKRIRKLDGDPPSTVPIIAVTADERFHSSQAVLACGMDGFLKKPIQMDMLSQTIEEYSA